MNVITSPHYNRPQCSSKMIEHLRNAIGIGDWKVIFIVEPGNEEVLNLCKNAQLPNYEVIENKRLLGLWQNKKNCLITGFSIADFVLHLEDDILISKDALLFYEWCRQTYGGQDRIFTINGFNKIKAFDFFCRKCHHCGTPFYGEVRRRNSYNSIGFATWANRWINIHKDWDGSDTYLEKYRSDNNLMEVYPTLSRINHIGHTQGISFPDELAKTMIESGLRPESIFLEEDKIIWKDGRPELLTNSLGNEWVKLNDKRCRSRKPLEFYMQHHYLDFWANKLEYEYGSFFE